MDISAFSEFLKNSIPCLMQKDISFAFFLSIDEIFETDEKVRNLTRDYISKLA